MMAFNPANRIASFSLYNNLRNIMKLLDKVKQMPSQLKGKDSIFRFNLKHDWFVKDFEDGKFKYKKIKAQSSELDFDLVKLSEQEILNQLEKY